MRMLDDPTGAFRRKFHTDRPNNYRYPSEFKTLTERSLFAAKIWQPLIDAERRKSSDCPYETACEIIDIACIPIDMFPLQKKPPGEVSKELQRYSNRIDTFLAAIEKLRKERLPDLQSRADHHTDFSRTGKVRDVGNLLSIIVDDLELLKLITDMPNAPRADIQPPKAGAARAVSTLRARILKREIKQRYLKPLHGVVAEIVNALDNLDPAYTEKDVSKA